MSIKVATGEHITINSVSDFQNGELLLKLSHALIKKPPPKINLKTTNKLSVVGNLQNILGYISADDVRITCSATGFTLAKKYLFLVLTFFFWKFNLINSTHNTKEIYDCNENMILGLLWVLVLKYQVIQKSHIINWYANITNQTVESITNLERQLEFF